MFYLSGAINVVLFLIIRPGLLLFPRPEQLDDEQESHQMTPQNDTGPTTSSDKANFQNSPEPTSIALEDGRPTDGTTSSQIFDV